MKRIVCLLLVIPFLLGLSACMIQKIPKEDLTFRDPAAPKETLSHRDPISPSFRSVAELIAALRAGTCKTVNGAYSLQFIRQAMDSVYIPASIPPGFVLRAIDLNQYAIAYYYMPAKDAKTFTFNRRTGITVVYSLEVVNASDPLGVIERQEGIPRDKNGFVYNPSHNRITFAPGNTWMTVTVPDSMNNYQTIKSLCVAEKIDLTAT